MNDKAILRQVEINIAAEHQSLVIHLNLFIPNDVPRPVPLFFLIPKILRILGINLREIF